MIEFAIFGSSSSIDFAYAVFFPLCMIFFFFFFVFLSFVVVVAISWAAPAAYGGSQARG